MDITHRFAHLALATATAGAFLAACNLPSAGNPSGIPTAPAAASPTDTPLPPLPPTPEPIRIWMSPALPEALRQPLEALQAVGDRAIVFVAAPDEADVRAEPVTDSSAKLLRLNFGNRASKFSER